MFCSFYLSLQQNLCDTETDSRQVSSGTMKKWGGMDFLYQTVMMNMKMQLTQTLYLCT